MKATIKSFTVSYSFDVFRSGEKISNFVSMNIDLEEPCNLNDFPVMQLEAAETVAKACIYDALARGSLSVQEANEKISNLTENNRKIRDKLISKNDS